MKIDQAISVAARKLINTGYEVRSKKWQGTEAKLSMWEAFNVNLVMDMPDSLLNLKELTGANQPWAEAHFQERVEGVPSNPGITYTQWPFYAQDDKMRPGEKFTHTYMERYFPKLAGFIQPVGTGFEDTTFYKELGMGNRGIHYPYGDLKDVINQLKEDVHTRQAYLPIFFPEDTGALHGGRVPCSLGYHFIVRHGYLHVNYYMRSCDFIRHFRDDIYLTIRLAHFVWGALAEVELGNLSMYITSLHVFTPELAKLKRDYPNI